MCRALASGLQFNKVNNIVALERYIRILGNQGWIEVIRSSFFRDLKQY